MNVLQILQSVKTILLVDWPDQRIPRSLLNAGFTVFGYSPDGYAQASLVSEPGDGDGGFAPRNESEQGYLVFKRLEEAPTSVDLVCVYRPEAEHPAIVEHKVLPLHARVLWLQAPLAAAQTASLAADKGLIYIENTDIAEIASMIKNK